jgi:hypothetical protein
MVFDKTEVDAIKRYCEKVFLLEEAGVPFLQLQRLRLPEGCTPAVCDALLCPVVRGGYPSRLYFAEPVSSAFTRNWNATNERICERNWHAYSWKVSLTNPKLQELLIAHLEGLARDK